GGPVRLVLARPGFVIGRMTGGMRPAVFSRTADQVATVVADAVRRRHHGELWIPWQLRAMFSIAPFVPRPVWRRMPRRTPARTAPVLAAPHPAGGPRSPHHPCDPPHRPCDPPHRPCDPPHRPCDPGATSRRRTTGGGARPPLTVSPVTNRCGPDWSGVA